MHVSVGSMSGGGSESDGDYGGGGGGGGHDVVVSGGGPVVAVRIVRGRERRAWSRCNRQLPYSMISRFEIDNDQKSILRYTLLTIYELQSRRR